MDRRACLLPPPARPSPGLGTDLSNALRPPQDFGPGCARLSAPAWGSSWGWRRPDGGAGREPESVEGDPSVSRALPSPPAFGLSGLCRLRRWGGSGRFLPGWGTELRNQPQEQSRGSPAPCPTCPGGLRPPPNSSDRSAARLPGSLPRRLRLGAGNAGAFWWEPTTLRGREADAAGRSFFLSPPPSSLSRTRASQPSAPNPILCLIRSEPPSHRDHRR